MTEQVSCQAMTDPKFTAQQLEQLAAAIADPELSLGEVPDWPQWFRDLAPGEKDAAMRQLMDSEQPKLDQALQDLQDEPMPFNMLALIEAGPIKEDEGPLALIQNIERRHAHSIAKWLVLATEKPVRLRLMAIGSIEEISYTPEEVAALAQHVKTIDKDQA